MERKYLCLAHMSGNEQKYVQEAFDTNWVVPLGPNVNAFEEELAKFLNQSQIIQTFLLNPILKIFRHTIIIQTNFGVMNMKI